MDYTICSRIIKSSKKSSSKSTKLIYSFISSSHKVVINKSILNVYSSYKTKNVQVWIDLMQKQGKWKKVKDIEYANEELFVGACSLTHDKKLIVKNKEDYTNKNCDKLNLLDTDEALGKVTTPDIIITGDDNNLTIGDNSPITTTGVKI